ncbi:hypothetical protein IR083_18475 [Dysgonomonas sp. GY75]|uniref:hypothetical protein n=1 Tax=Dysgonomonas sp. GY75 TaxID=2780419 RepID=UPI0018844BED|nr:hypothetical protein [Dysgonomonas sp. GY75]MBF0650808.1 hypothetical protein [Dysgonomonas sp. GY75]
MAGRRGTIPVAPGYWSNPFIGEGADGDKQGSQLPCQKGAQARGGTSFDFLSARFDPYPVVQFSELYSEENYDFLYRSAKNYLRLLGQEMGMGPDGYDFTGLYNYFNRALPDNQYCELCRYGTDIYFHVIEDSFGWELYYIPCAVIGKVKDEQFRDILLDFFNLLQQTQGLTPLKEDPVYQIFISDTGHYTLKDKQEREKLADDYEKGSTGEILDRISQPVGTTIPALKKRIDKYNPRPQEAGIIALMLEGLELFGRRNRKKKITSYGFFPDETEDYYNYYYPVEVCRTLMIVYEEDMLYKFLSEWITDEAQEQSAEIFSAGNKVISPRTKAPLKADPYVTDFFNWLKRFENELSYL